MRIYSSTIGLLSASLASTAVGSGVTFETKGFAGATLPYNGGTTQSTCLNQTQIDAGNNGTPGQWMITWSPSKTNNGPTINNIVLATKEDPDDSIAYGTDDSSQSTTSGARRLLFERNSIQRDDDSQDPQFFLADFNGGSLSLAKQFVDSTLTSHQNKPLFFQVEWTDDSTGQTGYSYSLLWALASDAAEAASLLSQYPSSMVTSASPAYTQGTSPVVTSGAMPTTTGAASSSDASSSSKSSTSSAATASSSAASSGSKAKSGGLSTGAIVGIVVGIVAALIIISAIAGCVCLRRRRRRMHERGGGAMGGGQDGAAGSRDARAMQDMMLAEKEARVGIMEGDQPDTPYSERAPPNPLGRGGLAMNESGVDMGVGQAVSGDNDGIAPCDRDRHHYHNNGNNNSVGVSDRHSGGVYISPVAGPASSSNDSSPTHSHPSSSSIYEPPSVPCPSTQQDHDYTHDVGPAPGTTVGGLPPCKQALLRQQHQQQHQQHDYNHHVAPPCPSTQQDHTYAHDVGPAPGTTVGGLPPCKQALLRQQQQQQQQQHEYSEHHDMGPAPGTTVGGLPPCKQAQLRQQQQQQQYDYSQHHHHVVDGGGGGGGGGAEADESQPISPDSTRGSRGAGFGSRSATPSGISGRYAHLIEEGMTEDEIRRMEEEERALDEAIERHGRG